MSPQSVRVGSDDARTTHGPDRDALGERDERHSGDEPDGRDERAIPADLSDVEAGDVLCDRHRRECFLVCGIDGIGISLRQEGHRFYVPHSLFVPWYGSRLFPIAETASTDRPDWCTTDGHQRSQHEPIEADSIE